MSSDQENRRRNTSQKIIHWIDADDEKGDSDEGDEHQSIHDIQGIFKA